MLHISALQTGLQITLMGGCGHQITVFPCRVLISSLIFTIIYTTESWGSTEEEGLFSAEIVISVLKRLYIWVVPSWFDRLRLEVFTGLIYWIQSEADLWKNENSKMVKRIQKLKQFYISCWLNILRVYHMIRAYFYNNTSEHRWPVAVKHEHCTNQHASRNTHCRQNIYSESLLGAEPSCDNLHWIYQLLLTWPPWFICLHSCWATVNVLPSVSPQATSSLPDGDCWGHMQPERKTACITLGWKKSFESYFYLQLIFFWKMQEWSINHSI